MPNSLSTYKFMRKELAKGRRYICWPNYDVLELLSDNGELTGFKMHYPNGANSFFERKKYKGTMSCNLNLHDLGVTFFVGDLDKYRKADDWYVDGKLFDEYGTRYNEIGFWKPIVFQRDADSIQNKVISLSINREIQGCLFYTFTTGHKAVEFVIKSIKNLFRDKKFQRPFFGPKKIEITKIQSDNPKFNLYDGTVYFNEKTPEDISKSIDAIKYYIKKFSRKDPNLKYVFKYNLYGSIKPKQSNDDTFTITIKGDDPRGILVTNNLGMFPKTDWRIKSEWIN